MGLYFKFSIVLFCIPIIAMRYINYKVFKNIYKQKRKLKLISFRKYFRYIKLIFNQKIILLIIISSIISNSIVLIKNTKFNELYKDEQELTIKGVIVSNKEEKEYKDIYKIKVKYCNEYSKYKNKYLYIRISKKMNVKVNYGDEIVIKGKFIEPSEQRNYGGFDYKRYLKTLNICGSIDVEEIQIKDIKKVNIIFYIANKLSSTIENKIDDLFEKEEASLLKGLILGKTSNIEDEIYEKFRVSSISHILAVSGMHISYIIVGSNLLLKKSLGKRTSKYIIIVILIIYMFITGFPASIVRATIMGVVVTLSGILHRKNDMWTSIALSLLIILLYNPFLIMNIGLQLSYIGTIGIILFNKIVLNIFKNIKMGKQKNRYKINRKKILFIKKIQDILAVTVSAQISILPVMLYHFNLFGTYFFITNLFVSIIIGPTIILGVITIMLAFIFIPISKILAIIVEVMVKILIQIANIGKLPFSKIYFPTPRVWMIVLYYVFISIFILIYPIYNSRKINITQQRFRNIIALIKYKFRESKQIIVKKILILLFIILFIFLIFPKNLKISFVDVGQGDCTFIVTPQNKTILIDGGGSLSNDFDIGKSTLLPYILDRGYKKIDYVIITHFDQDHVGGILTILKELKVGQVIISKQGKDSKNYQEFLDIVKQKRIKVQIVKKGDKINIEKDLNIEVLWPQQKLIEENVLNNNAIVFRLNYFKFSMLFTGDIEEIAEEEILKKVNNKLLKADVLKVAHHGSKSSSIQTFLDKVKPKIALIGVGENNTFGHPNIEVIKRLKEGESEVYRTDKNGEIIIIVHKNGKIKVKKFIE